MFLYIRRGAYDAFGPWGKPDTRSWLIMTSRTKIFQPLNTRSVTCMEKRNSMVQRLAVRRSMPSTALSVASVLTLMHNPCNGQTRVARPRLTALCCFGICTILKRPTRTTGVWLIIEILLRVFCGYQNPETWALPRARTRSAASTISQTCSERGLQKLDSRP